MSKLYHTVLSITIVALLACFALSGWNTSRITLIATRYHLSERTTNFFDRAKGSSDSKNSASSKPVEKPKTPKAQDKNVASNSRSS
jgi:hypothetical protein